MFRGADVPLYFGIAALVLAVGALVWLGFFEFRLRKLFRGHTADDLETLMRAIARELDRTGGRATELEAAVANIEERLRSGGRSFGLVRFNPYSDGGGDQSFALAVVNELHDGFVLSSLYHREGTRFYAKPVASGKSTYPLSAEEYEALERARAGAATH